MEQNLRIGIDLGGTKIAAIAIDKSDKVLATRRIPSPQGNYAETIRAITDLVLSLEKELNIAANIGIGMPGSISPVSGLVQNSNSTWLNGQNLKADIETALQRPARFANDANCFALSEATDGAASGHAVVFGVILGTGCGGGVVVHGQLLQGQHPIAGEWGHIPLPWTKPDEYPGNQCWCGRTGCLETWLSGTALEHDHLQATGNRLMGEEIAATAQTGDTAAQATLARHTDRLARGLSVVTNLLDPDVIVLGGGLSNLDHLYNDVAPLMCKHVFAGHPAPRIVRPMHGDASGVRGAARLWD